MHSDELHGIGALDSALGGLNYDFIASLLESWFISISNKPRVTPSDERRWSAGLDFVVSILGWLQSNSDSNDQIRIMEEKLHRIRHLYRQLHIGSGIHEEPIRSLPSAVVEYLYEILDPESLNNPFSEPKIRWRGYIIFILMLHYGLRRGELLLLPLDCVKSGWDKRKAKARYWINVRYNEYDNEDDFDTRYSKPSIKTASSIRQIPISETVAKLIQIYVENYRGRLEHPYLLASNLRNPLSAEALTKSFKVITKSIPANVMAELRDRNGSSKISPHDLRHTCAVFRLNQLVKNGDDIESAIPKLRPFFGWSKDSVMPSKYGRAFFEDRLSEVWNCEFDDRIELLKLLPV
jgi:integrase